MSLQDSLEDFLRKQGCTAMASLKYSRRLGDYNANVRKRGSSLSFHLSAEWKSVGDEIVLGLLQSLSCRLLKIKNGSINIDLYNNFIRSLHLSQAKTNKDPFLEESFNRVNEKYFEGLVEKPNFGWHNSLRRLASYNYQTDTVSVSRVFQNRGDIIDYLMYHELLHKKLKYSSRGSRTMHHSGLFRNMERKFENAELLEKEIRKVLRNG